MECPMCARAVEDCPHLFFACTLAQEVWQAAGVGRLVATSEEAFWRASFETISLIFLHEREMGHH